MKTRTILATLVALALAGSGPLGLQVLGQIQPQVPTVTITTADRTAKEQNPLLDSIPDTARMVLKRSMGGERALEVKIGVGGTALPGVDHDLKPGVVTIPEGALELEIVITALDDELVEPEESVLVTVLPSVPTAGTEPAYRVGGAFQASAVLLDDEPRPNLSPRAAVLSPPDGAVLLAPEMIQIVVAATDLDGWVQRVEFFDGEKSLGVVERGQVVGPMPMEESYPGWGPMLPFVLRWDNPAVGAHVLTAVATDNDGASTRSGPVEITVLEGGTLPVVTVVTTDAEGAEVAAGPDGVVMKNVAVFEIRRSGSVEEALEVTFRLGGVAKNGVDYEEVKQVATLPAGASSVEVVIDPVDDALVEGCESVVLELMAPASVELFPPVAGACLLGRAWAARAVILDNDQPVNQPPIVEMVHPHDGEVFLAGVDLRLSARAHDRTGKVVSVEFFEGERSLGLAVADLGMPGMYRFVWEDVRAGGYVLTAVATDDAGLKGTSQAVEIKVVTVSRPPVVTVAAVDPEGMEMLPELKAPSNPAIFRVKRTGATEGALGVSYKLGGTAVNGVDYELLPMEVKFEAGQAEVDVVVSVLDDLLSEGPEGVVLTLVPSACLADELVVRPAYMVGIPGMARAVILDNEAPANLPPRVAMVTPRPGSIFKEGTSIEMVAATRDADGYVWKMEFYAGDRKIGEDSFLPLIAPPPGQDQKFGMTWADAPAGTHVLRAKAHDNQGAETWSGPVGIAVVNDDPQLPPLVTVVATDPLAIEPDDAHAPDVAIFTVRRTGGLALPLTVEYAVGGSAGNGADYEALSGEVTIPEGRATAEIVVTPLADEWVERGESVVIELKAPACIAIYPPPPECYGLGLLSRAEAKILDRTPAENLPPRVELVRPYEGEVFQVPGPVKLVAMADDRDGRVVKVAFYADGVLLGEQLAPEPALSAADAAGRAFTWAWSGVPAGRHVLAAVATDDGGATGKSREVTIGVREGNLPPVVRIVTTDPLARERGDNLPANTATFKVHRTGSLDADLMVWYSLRGKAVNGKDYLELAGTVLIPAGKRHGRILVDPINDAEVERAESVVVKLEPSPTMGPREPYVIGWPEKACAVILDNDLPDPGVGPLGDDVFSVGVAGATGAPYQVEASDDLVTWVPVAEGVAMEGRVCFAEPDMSGLKHRFYRVRPLVMEALGLDE